MNCKAICVCVNYDDLLAITLPKNAPHFREVLVVTAPNDLRTPDVVSRVPNARLFVTDAFYRNGARFNKGLAMEEGFNALPREGWIVVFDADIVMPSQMNLAAAQIGNLYSPHRVVLEDLRRLPQAADEPWPLLPMAPDGEQAGYFQLFHADDPALRRRPWYGVHWEHAGGCDSEFTWKWSASHKKWLDFSVLHLGKLEANWCGRMTDRIDGVELCPEHVANSQAAMQLLRDRKRSAHCWPRSLSPPAPDVLPAQPVPPAPPSPTPAPTRTNRHSAARRGRRPAPRPQRPQRRKR